MARREEAETNYWPGFVDALSTIVMVLTFVLIILILVIFAISQTLVKEVITNARDGGSAQQAAALNAGDGKASRSIIGTEANPNIIGPQNVEDIEQGYEGNLDLKQVSNSDAPVLQIDVEEDEKQRNKSKGPTRIEKSREVINLKFAPQVTDIEKKQADKIINFIKENKAKYDDNEITIIGFTNKKAISLSIEKRRTFFRVMSARNALLEAGIKPEFIKTKLKITDKKEFFGQVKIFRSEKK